MTILIGAIVAFILWHFIPQHSPRANPRFRLDPRIAVGNLDWQTAVEEQCESPAELAFLKAMIGAYRLRPNNGSLSNSDLKLDLQVEQSNYRADFLVNDWLVVEIDGAAWHSSPEQQHRDAIRDDHFQNLGYAVLRIPAKTVFQRPRDAVIAVSKRLERGKPHLAEPKEPSGFDRLATTMRDIGSGVAQINRSVAIEGARMSAMTAAEEAFASELRVLALAMEAAERKVKTDDLCNTPEKRQLWEDSFRKMSAIYAQVDTAPQATEPVRRLVVAEMVRPGVHHDPVINGAIQSSFDNLLRKRDSVYAIAYKRIEQDTRLRLHAMRWLFDWQHWTVAERLHGLEITKPRNFLQMVEWQNTLIHGTKDAP